MSDLKLRSDAPAMTGVRCRLPRVAVSLVAAATVTACSFAPTYERPEAPVPSAYPGQTGGAPALQVEQLQSAVDWRGVVPDTRLRDLIDLALLNNRDLRLATLNMEQVRAQYAIQRVGQLPTVNLSASGNRVPTAAGSISSTYTVGVGISAWEIDFFGRLASLRDAALAQYLASEEARHTAQASLVASVVNAWLALQSDEQLLALARDTLTSRRESLRLMRLRFDNGASSALDLRQSESLAESARATVAQQQRQRAQDLNALRLLIGQDLPAHLLPSASSVTDSGSEAMKGIPAGLPSDLMIRRPDVRQAEQQLIAANANIGAARAAFFPRISLTAAWGSASSELSGLFKDGSWGFTLAPQMVLPIFSAGRNQASLDSAWVARDAAVAQYEKTIQTAFKEVADALAGQATLGEQRAALEAQVKADAERLRLSQLRFDNGVASSLELLDAQRSWFATQQALVQVQLAWQLNRVALFKALGGGWSVSAT